ncbi:hypothetical protein CLV35_2875 [Motilibacter peucedani]|uniref:Uncharacterized protein n=1 Tax=Motilibacter peucedani TaxID=598650 RepID=A0A420XMX4_9ACTN|nr:hypothetical protein CLV35_2875 [Motilibacter peucedani]
MWVVIERSSGQVVRVTREESVARRYAPGEVYEVLATAAGQPAAS